MCDISAGSVEFHPQSKRPDDASLIDDGDDMTCSTFNHVSPTRLRVNVTAPQGHPNVSVIGAGLNCSSSIKGSLYLVALSQDQLSWYGKWETCALLNVMDVSGNITKCMYSCNYVDKISTLHLMYFPKLGHINHWSLCNLRSEYMVWQNALD